MRYHCAYLRVIKSDHGSPGIRVNFHHAPTGAQRESNLTSDDIPSGAPPVFFSLSLSLFLFFVVFRFLSAFCLFLRRAPRGRSGKYRREGERKEDRKRIRLPPSVIYNYIYVYIYIYITWGRGDAIISRADRRRIVVRGKGTIGSIIEPPSRD